VDTKKVTKKVTAYAKSQAFFHFPAAPKKLAAPFLVGFALYSVVAQTVFGVSRLQAEKYRDCC
jgi:hypothetical protein